jgi:hypothetical protein
MRPGAYGWGFYNENFLFLRCYYGYTKREAIKNFRKDFNLKYKRIIFL